MAKRNVMINIDSETLERFDRAIGQGNRSEAISKYMETYSLTKDDDVDGINAEILRREITELNRGISDLQAQRESKQQVLDEYYRCRDEKEQQELQDQRDKLEAASKCINCGNFLDDRKKQHKFSKGNVCHACYLGMTGEDVKKWS